MQPPTTVARSGGDEEVKFGSASILLGAMLIAFAAPAAAQSTGSFRLGGMQFTVPIPAGYCLPSGSNIEVAQLLAAADDRNVTHLTLYRCGQSGAAITDYILIKTPIEALLIRASREQLLQALGAEFQGPLGSAAGAEALTNQAESRVSSVLGAEVNLTGVVRPLGLDSFCAYMGGTMQVTSSLGNYTGSLGMCMTAVSERMVTINWYGADGGSAGVAELLRRSRQLAERITATPAP
jgi:hypothetical protein